MEKIQVSQNTKDAIIGILNNETSSINQKIADLRIVVNNISNLPYQLKVHGIQLTNLIFN